MPSSLLASSLPASTREEPIVSSPSESEHVESSFLSTASSQSNFADTTFLSTSTCSSKDSERRRRKRTTVHDKAILEAAYQRDAKPDKHARLEIVSQVSMNEKEVQIWFQNRRQNDRRKSRPLSLQEVETLRYRSAGVYIAPSVATNVSPYNTTTAVHIVDTVGTVATSATLPFGSDSSLDSTSPHPPNPATFTQAPAESTLISSQHTNPEPPNKDSERIGYVSNRRNLDSTSSTQSHRHFKPSIYLPPVNANNMAPRRAPLSNLLNDAPASPFKIRLSLDGKAQLAPSISPPRPQRTYTFHERSSIPRLATKLNRSQSNISSTTLLPPISSLLENIPPRLSRGRSRNAQMWEQIADATDPTPTVADSLITQAEDEACGSARAAISLIRCNNGSSSSYGNALANNNGKRNALTPSHHSHSGKKARLGRAASSLVRFEIRNNGQHNTIQEDSQDEIDDAPRKPKGGAQVATSSPTDSDKENWSPSSSGNSFSHTLPPQTQIPRELDASWNIFKDNISVGGRRLFMDTASDKKRLSSPSVSIFEDTRSNSPSEAESDSEPEQGEDCRYNGLARKLRGAAVPCRTYTATDLVHSFGVDINSAPDADVDGFMRDEQDLSPSRKGDRDAIRGLLSLKGAVSVTAATWSSGS